MAMNFNGSNQYVSLSDNMVFSNTEITIMTWVTAAAMPTGMSVICSTNSMAAGYRAPFALYFSGGRLGAQIAYAYRAGFIITYTAYDIVTAVSNSVTPVNTWKHVALTYSNGAIRLFENGKIVGETITNRAPVSGNTATVGADRNGANSYQAYFSGTMEDFRIYDRAMTANEILTISTLRGKDTIINQGVTQMGMNEMPNNVAHPSNTPVFNLFKSSVIATAVNGPSYRDSFANVLKRW